MMELEIQGKNGQFKEWLRGAKYSNLSNASGFNSAKLILLEDLPGYNLFWNNILLWLSDFSLVHVFIGWLI